jgi:RHS repeat-associated protein
MPGGTNLYATSEYFYDSYGNTTQISEWNYYSTMPTNADRTTCITYLNGTNYLSAHILNRPSSVTVVNNWSATPCTSIPGADIIAQTTYSYDGSALASATGTKNHDDTNYGTGYTTRGNATQVQRLISGSSNYLTKTMTYDMTGQVKTATDWSNSNTTTYTYADNFFNDNGNGSNPVSYTPATPTNAYLTTVALPLIPASTFGYYFGTGQLASATDPNGNTTYSHFYDSLNRPTATSLPNNGWTLAQYNSTDTEVDVYTGITNSSPSTSCTGSLGGCRRDETLLDGLGRVTSQILLSDPDGQTTVATAYDLNSRVLKTSNPYRSISDPTYGFETPTYDGLNRVTKVTHQDNNYATTSYGPAVGATVSQSCSASTYGRGYPVLVVDEAGNKRQTWTDGFGRVIETDEPNASGMLSAYTCYSYDLNNNLTGVLAADGTQTRTYTYDMLSRLTLKTEPESGTTNFYYTTSGGSLCSGDPSEVCRRTDARSITTTYSYDALNRLTGKSYSDSTSSVTYSNDQTSYNGLTITNGKGRRTGMSDGSGQTAWSYDSLGNILTEKRTINGQTKTMSYTYNYDGSIATITYPGNRTVTYNVGNAQRPTSAQDTTNSINFVTNGTYAPPGGPGSFQNGSSLVSTYFYNNRLEPCRISVKNTGTAPSTCASATAGTVFDLTFSYVSGNNGNTATQTNNVTSGRTQNYTYDPLNRLLTAQASASSGGDCWGQSFGNGGPPPTMAADALANLFYSTSTQCSSPQPRFTVNGNNQFTGTGISYDSDGDMTQDTVYSYTYNAENRIITATGMTGGPYCYTYDGNGLRVMKAHANGGSCTGTVTVDMLYWRNIAGNTIAETDGSGSTTNSSYNEYLFFAGRRIAQSNPSSGSVYYYFVDHLGSTRVVTTATGTACYEVDYLPYGNENTPSGFTNTCSTRYRFTGYERDAETAYGTSAGNDYAFARYYNSRLGRFMTGDPLGGDTSDPQTLNRYSYVRNNSLNAVDPSGMNLAWCEGWRIVRREAENGSPYFTWDVQLGFCLTFGEYIPDEADRGGGDGGGGGQIFDPARTLANKILSRNNDCSNFFNSSGYLSAGLTDFGAPALTAAQALGSDHLIAVGGMNPNQGGGTTVGADVGVQSVIQLNGAPNGAFLSNYAALGGVIPSGSLAGQTVQILHELAHTLLLIPNDVDLNDQAIDHTSDINTNAIIKECGLSILGAVSGSN